MIRILFWGEGTEKEINVMQTKIELKEHMKAIYLARSIDHRTPPEETGRASERAVTTEAMRSPPLADIIVSLDVTPALAAPGGVEKRNVRRVKKTVKRTRVP